jgi:hypothetical protein
MNILRAGYVLVAIVSHVSNSLRGEIFDWKRMRTVVAIIWLSEYGIFPILWIS